MNPFTPEKLYEERAGSGGRCAVATGSDAVCWTDEELKAFAGAKCLDIFDNMTEADAMASPWWIRQAWNIGKAIRLKHQNSFLSDAAKGERKPL